MAAGLTIPFGGRPSVGVGFWLLGGLGHLGQLYGLACDAIAGAVVVSVASAQTLCISHLPEEDRPVGAIWPDNEDDLSRAIRGADIKFDFAVSVNLEADGASTYRIRSWLVLQFRSVSETRPSLARISRASKQQRLELVASVTTSTERKL
ncbi:hypothetical protein LTR35_017734 [Friedmanniomyces endolithicus]|uniref:Uncharacterized protein n=1 Tax=Friedmanniomyces endolithicus TaxID=329885 RepID=A0AAN6F5D2_9PEZI|nr:hypothetical protein LTR35_017734 [Friedmanniomyces endolithicus]KAK0268141.1 hypothetical protein LTS00_017644 [Friedmanniomyces endolithicus]KAK0303015.1 hypothetical protein LTR82_017679 [Friedmanniomyces endolithicus]